MTWQLVREISVSSGLILFLMNLYTMHPQSYQKSPYISRICYNMYCSIHVVSVDCGDPVEFGTAFEYKATILGSIATVTCDPGYLWTDGEEGTLNGMYGYGMLGNGAK